MMSKTTKWFMVWGMLVMLVLPFFAAGQQLKIDTNKLQLANRYYQSKQYEKASVLFKELYQTSESQYYFEVYLNCLIETADFATAEKEIKQELRRTSKDAVLYVQWSNLLKRQNRIDEGDAMLEKAIGSVQNNKADYVRLANALIGKGEYDFAKKLYLLGREKMPGEQFHYELGRVFLYQRDYEQMFEEYLALIQEDETALGRMQSVVQSAFRLDIDNSLHGQLRSKLLKRMQQNPDILVYNRLLIWLFLQENNFTGALRQQLALDRRTGQEDQQIIDLARIAGRNSDYVDALKAYDYLIDKGERTPLLREARQERMQLVYQQFTETTKEQQLIETDGINQQFETTLNLVGYDADSYRLIIDYAHFLAFYAGQTEKSMSLLHNGMSLPQLMRQQQDEMKTELADINVYCGDMWEAVLLYSQVIESNKTNSLGDEVKLKKARLGYYMGELKWAKAQLDVIKASTSKLVANDAMELSLFIGNNTNLDTTQVPVQLFAKADLYSFRNEKEKAWAVLDSIELEFPFNSLIDDIYYRKANLLAASGDHEQAAVYLEKIVTGFSSDLLADDALFRLAGIYQTKLHQKDKALELYKRMLVDYPGSVYVTESRKLFRELRGDFGEEEQETKFFNGENVN